MIIYKYQQLTKKANYKKTISENTNIKEYQKLHLGQLKLFMLELVFLSKYAKDGICVNCHDSCNGCTGPRNTIATDGCIDCDHAIISGDGTIEKCLKKGTACPGEF